MLYIASRDGPSDEELIREIRHTTEQLIPELIKRHHTQADEGDAHGDEEDWIALGDEFDVEPTVSAVITELRNYRNTMKDADDALEAAHFETETLKTQVQTLEAQVKALEAELALIS